MNCVAQVCTFILLLCKTCILVINYPPHCSLESAWRLIYIWIGYWYDSKMIGLNLLVNSMVYAICLLFVVKCDIFGVLMEFCVFFFIWYGKSLSIKSYL